MRERVFAAVFGIRPYRCTDCLRRFWASDRRRWSFNPVTILLLLTRR
jgi:hypothetical protein